MNVSVQYETKAGALIAEQVSGVDVVEVDEDGTLRLFQGTETRVEVARYNDPSWIRWQKVP